MAEYFIGDIHGCNKELNCLIDKLSLKAEDKIYFAGDLVNRGPESIETIRTVMGLENASIVLGNHDLYLIACYFNEIPKEYTHTFHRVMAANDCDQIIEWLIKQPLYRYFKEDDLLLVHAGFYPWWSINEGMRLADETSKQMQKNPEEFFKLMFGNESINWSQAKTNEQKQRFVINAFTRMRYVYSDGTLEFTSHKPPPHTNKSLKPWFDYIDKKVVFGHWSALGGYQQKENIMALDGGCVWGGELLAWEKQSKKWISYKK